MYVYKEIFMGLALGLAAGGLWKAWHWQTRTRIEAMYANPVSSFPPKTA